jgi:hypothetical protein
MMPLWLNLPAAFPPWRTDKPGGYVVRDDRPAKWSGVAGAMDVSLFCRCYRTVGLSRRLRFLAVQASKPGKREPIERQPILRPSSPSYRRPEMNGTAILNLSSSYLANVPAHGQSKFSVQSDPL